MKAVIKATSFVDTELTLIDSIGKRFYKKVQWYTLEATCNNGDEYKATFRG